MAENDVICLGLEYNKSFTTIRSRKSNILLKVAEELKMLSGADIVVLTISSRNRRARYGTLGSQYYVLQRWMDIWGTYVNVDSIEQLQDRDKSRSARLCTTTELQPRVPPRVPPPKRSRVYTGVQSYM